MSIRCRKFIKPIQTILTTLTLAGCAATSMPNGGPNYGEILTNMNRPEAERAIDAVRKPHQVMAFYAVKQGDKVADIFASRGYYTAILAQLVGVQGVVYSANPAPRQELHDRLKQPGMANVRVLDGPFDKLLLPQDGSLDFVLLHLDYHEIAREVRGEMNKKIFGALKRGGSYGVVDHSAKEGAGDSEAKTLHRMDKLLVIKEAASVGFRLAEEGKMLSRADDTRDFSVIKIRDKSDRFVLKFVKP
jgi:predicted methyltransferase